MCHEFKALLQHVGCHVACRPLVVLMAGVARPALMLPMERRSAHCCGSSSMKNATEHCSCCQNTGRKSEGRQVV
jgi:hypothetical protein